jgi:hypothetical protein
VTPPRAQATARPRRALQALGPGLQPPLPWATRCPWRGDSPPKTPIKCNCNVNVHLCTHTVPYQPTIRMQNAHTLNIALYKVESEIESEQWSHYCSTRPIAPREVAVREERTSDRMLANPFALVNPIALPNFAGTPGRQQALATSVGVAGGGPSHGDSAVVEAPRRAMDTGAGPTDADPPPVTGDDSHTRGMLRA